MFMSTAAWAQEPEAQPDAVGRHRRRGDRRDRRRSTTRRPRSSCSRRRSRRCRNRSPRSRPPRPRPRRRGRARRSWRTRKPAGASRSAAASSMTPAMSPIRTTIPTAASLTRNLGFNTRARRIRLGAEGTIPGGFGYKCEMDFANASVGFGDCILSYTPTNKPFNVAIGNQETNNGLEQISSSRFIELHRARRVRRRLHQYPPPRHQPRLCQQGRRLPPQWRLVADHSIDSSLDNDGWIGAARAVYCAADGRQPAALRPQLPAPRVPEEQRLDRVAPRSARRRPTSWPAIAPGPFRS